jgi:hypothetical protein
MCLMALYKGNSIIGTDGQYAGMVLNAETIGIYHPGTVVAHLEEIRKCLSAPAAALAKTIINVRNGHVIEVRSSRTIVLIIPVLMP